MKQSRYIFHELLGQRARGSVYRAADKLTGEAVALKQLTEIPNQIEYGGTAGEYELRFDLAHEFQTLVGLRHPISSV